MSIRLTRASSQKLSRETAPNYNAAYTFLLAFRPTTTTETQFIASIRRDISNWDSLVLDNAVSDLFCFRQSVANTVNSAFGDVAAVAGTWYYLALVRHSATSVELFVGTSPETMASATGGPVTLATVGSRLAAVGVDIGTVSTSVNYANGRVRYGRVFESALSLADIKAAAGTMWAEWLLPSAGSTDDTSGNNRHLTATGTPSTEADDSVTWPESSGITGSGTPTKTLAASAAGSAQVDAERWAIVSFIELEIAGALVFTGSGTPTKTLSASAAGSASQTFTGSGTPAKTLAPSAVGAAVYADVIAATAMPTVTLVASATGEGTHLVDTGTASGAPTKILSTSADGTATQTFTGSGTPEATLVVSAVGSAEMVGFDGPFLVGVTGPLVSTASREIAWPGVAAAAEDSLIEVNDIALLFIGSKNEPIGTLTPGAANSDGNNSNFSPISAATVGVGTAGNATAVRLEVRWARATSHNMRSTLIPDPGAVVIAAMAVFRGCEVTGDPFDVVSTLTVSPAETNVRFQELVTTVTNALIVGVSLNAIDADSTATGSGYTNASLSSITEMFDRAFTTGPGGIGLVGITGEKIEAGTVGDTTGTYIDSVRSAAATIALKPPPAPLDPSTGTGAPTKTLSASAVGAAAQKFSGSGAPTKTLSASAAGTATQRFTGSGAVSKTLATSVSATATRAADVFATSADPTAILDVTVRGRAFSQGIPANDPPPLVPGDGGRGRRKPRRLLLPEEETEQPRKKHRRPRPAPAPVLEALPLAELPPAPAPFAPVTFDPMLWASVSAPPVRPQTPVVTQQDIAEEEAFLAQLLDLI